MKRFPIATISLGVVLLLSYLYFSGGRPFIEPDDLLSLAFFSANPAANLFLHLFAHLGLKHLLGNLIPLLFFAALLELSAGPLAVIAVFFISGIAASVAFSFISPSLALAGASGGVAGLIGAAALARPKYSAVLLLLMPLAVQFLLFPAVDAGVAWQKSSLEQDKAALAAQVQAHASQNDTEHAQIANETLQAVAQQSESIASGESREQQAEDGTIVHLLGALVGMAYLGLRRPDLVDAGSAELFSLVGHPLKKKK